MYFKLIFSYIRANFNFYDDVRKEIRSRPLLREMEVCGTMAYGAVSLLAQVSCTAGQVGPSMLTAGDLRMK